MMLLNFAKYKGFLFDLDGTLTDSRWIWREADIEFVEKKGANLSQDDKENIKERHPHFIDYKWGEYLISTYKIEGISADQVAEGIYQLVAEKFRTANYKPYASEFLQILGKNRKTLGLVSNAPCLLLNAFQYENLNTSNINSVFGNHIITSDMIEKKKPAPDIYIKALNVLGLNADECIVFEDSLSGVISSLEAGIDTCVVYDKDSDKQRDQLYALTPYHIAHFGELLNCFSNK